MNVVHWHPSSILTGAHKSPFCLVILNQPIVRLDIFERLWRNASIRLVADGGSNRLYDALKHDPDKLAAYLPDGIRGDLDSIRPSVRDYYESKNVPVTKISEQISTDFMKCVALLKDMEAKQQCKYNIVGFPSLGGRFDQIMANIQQLFMVKEELDRQAVLVGDESLLVLLDKGSHRIQSERQVEGATCGLIPIGFPTILTTKGLRWNLDHQPSYFGGLVSTSNAIDHDIVEVETDAPVVWTVELRENLSLDPAFCCP